MKSELIKSNYENWMEEEVYGLVETIIDNLFDELDIVLVKYVELNEEDGIYLLLDNNDYMYIFRDGISEEVDGFAIEINDIGVSEIGIDVDREEICAILQNMTNMELERI